MEFELRTRGLRHRYVAADMCKGYIMVNIREISDSGGEHITDCIALYEEYCL